MIAAMLTELPLPLPDGVFGPHGVRAMALSAIGEDAPRWVHARVFSCLAARRTFLWGWYLMSATSKRWLARASFALMFAAVVLVVAVAGWRSVTLVVLAVAGVCAVLAGGYWFLANRGVLRWLALVLVVAAPVLIVVAFAWHHLVWVAVVAVALMLAAAGAARAALSTGGQDAAMPAVPAARPRRPFVIMNPRSGGGKVGKFGLKEKAEKLGAEVALLEGPGIVDVAALARRAVADGADLLGVAGGDGTQALVAGIAAEHHLPFLVISAGTRNHFALDLGLDREDPAACLEGLTDGEELRVDLGIIGGRTFVNNASFGAYAEVVQSPAYRDDKRGTTLQLLPDLLKGHHGAHLTARAAGTTIEGPQALLVSNDPYGMGDMAGLGRRARLDAGTLGVVAIRIDSARQAAGLIRRGHGTGLTTLTTTQVTVDADAPEIPVGIDGETVMLPTPVHCTIHPQALRVIVPRQRPGVPAPKPPLEWPRLRQLASFRTHPDSQPTQPATQPSPHAQ
jgi:diacylglycerol kinase family enzyme